MFEPGHAGDDDWGVLGSIAGWSWRFLVSLLALAVVLLILVQLKFVLVPLLLAILVSSVLSPMTGWIERKGVARGFASTLTVLFAIGVVVGLSILALPPFISNLKELQGALDQSSKDLYNWLAGSPLNMTPDQIADIKKQAESLGPKVQDFLVQGFKSAVPILGQAIAMVGLTIVLTGYLLADGHRYWQWALGFFSPTNRPALNELGVTAYQKLAIYLRATAQMAALYGFGVGLFAFLLDVRLAVVLGLIVFALAFLPIIGAWTSGFIVAVMSFVSGGVGTMVAMIIVMLLLSQINSVFLRPKVVGDRVALVPVVTLTTVLAGTTIAGVIGGILAVPVVATVSGALGQVRRWRAEGGVPTTDPILDKRLDPDVDETAPA